MQTLLTYLDTVRFSVAIKGHLVMCVNTIPFKEISVTPSGEGFSYGIPVAILEKPPPTLKLTKPYPAQKQHSQLITK